MISEDQAIRIPHRNWIFDLDGTLTLATHDFESFKRSQNLDLARPVLEQIAQLPEAQAAQINQALLDWEGEIADRSQAAPDALVLVQALHSRGDRLGILTRNTRKLALRTIAAAGMGPYFPPDAILGRNCATPKPSPDGLHRILEHWGIEPHQAVMLGDYLFDLQAGRAAGMFTVYIDRDNTRMWQDQADLRLERLDHLLD